MQIRVLGKLGCVFAFAAVVGCGQSDTCVSGATVECACLGGGSAIQTCNGDGEFDACQCESDDEREEERARSPEPKDDDDSADDDDADTEESPEQGAAENSEEPGSDEAGEMGGDAEPEEPNGGKKSPEEATAEGAEMPGQPSSEPAGEMGGDPEQEAPNEPSMGDAGAALPEAAQPEPPACDELFPTNFTQSTTIAPGCYRVVAPPSFANRAELTLTPGVRLQFSKNAWLEIPESNSLRAFGTEAEPIVFTGEVEERGAWGGLFVEGRATLEHTQVLYAGKPIPSEGGDRDAAGLAVSPKGTLALTNSRIAFNDGYGLWNRAEMTAFENNTITGNALCVILAAGDAPLLDKASSFSGNDLDRIVLTERLFPEPVVPGRWKGAVTDGTWFAHDAPYVVTHGLYAHNVVLEEGVRIQFAADTGIAVRDNLVSTGTEENPVVLEPFIADRKWGGVAFCDGANGSLEGIVLIGAPPSSDAFGADACPSFTPSAPPAVVPAPTPPAVVPPAVVPAPTPPAVVPPAVVPAPTPPAATPPAVVPAPTPPAATPPASTAPVAVPVPVE